MSDERQREGPQPESSGRFPRQLAAVVGAVLTAVALLAVVGLAGEILLMGFGGILLGVFLLALRDGLARHTPLPEGWALLAVILLLLALLGAGGALLAPLLSAQVDELRAQLPGIAAELRGLLLDTGVGRRLLDHLEREGMEEASGWLGSALALTARGAVFTIGILFVGLFVAVNPGLYTEGVVGLFPRAARRRARLILTEMGGKLRHFLVTRAIAMLLVGVSTSVALGLLYVPLALLLGFIAGLFTFVPYLGPIAAAVPIVLVALLESPQKALVALVVYAIIQWIEGYLFDPLIVQRIVRIPPALTVFAQILGGALFGVAGVAVATPFVAIAQVIVRRAYREALLGDAAPPSRSAP